MHTLKVRDRTSGKVKEAMVDAEDYARLKDYAYMTDKNSDEPFREEIQPDGKRPRIALKRDVMGYKLGDPRRVCYVNKSQLFDCRKSNLKVKTDTPVVNTTKKVKEVKAVKTTSVTKVKGAKKVKTKVTKVLKTTPVMETPVMETPVMETPVMETPVMETPTAAPTTTNKSDTTLYLSDLEVKKLKKALLLQMNSEELDTLLDSISVDNLLCSVRTQQKRTA